MAASVGSEWYKANPIVNRALGRERSVTMPIRKFYEFLRSAGARLRPDNESSIAAEGLYDAERSEITFSRSDLPRLAYSERGIWADTGARIAKRIERKEVLPKPVLKARVFDELWLEPTFQNYLQGTKPDRYWDEVQARMVDAIVSRAIKPKTRDEAEEAERRAEEAAFLMLMDTNPDFRQFTYDRANLSQRDRASPQRARYKALTQWSEGRKPTKSRSYSTVMNALAFLEEESGSGDPDAGIADDENDSIYRTLDELSHCRTEPATSDQRFKRRFDSHARK